MGFGPSAKTNDGVTSNYDEGIEGWIFVTQTSLLNES